jgi:hypothetical protein
MDPTSIQSLCPSDSEDSDLFMQWQQHRVERRLAREKRFQLPNIWDWDGTIFLEGEHHHHHLSENITLKTLFNVLKPDSYMKYWIRQKKMQPDTILFLRFNNWFHAFHQDADVIRSIFDVEYDPGNVARVSIHCMYVESLFETIESENYESDIFYFMHTNVNMVMWTK